MSDADRPLNKQDQNRLKEKRGEGVGKDYVPFIKVGEFSSSGESVRINGFTSGRAHHFHSGIELAAFLVFDWCKGVVDIREQFPIPLADSLVICRQLGIKHPQERGELRIVTTDLLIDLVGGKQLAIPVKPAEQLDKKRVAEKLQIEKSYWEGLGVECLFFTEKDISNEIKMNLKWLSPILNVDHQATHQFSDKDILNLVSRFAKQPTSFVTRYCAQLDDEYQLEPGHHIEMFRYGVAHHYLKAPLQTEFHSWKCKDIEHLAAQGDGLRVGDAS